MAVEMRFESWVLKIKRNREKWVKMVHKGRMFARLIGTTAHRQEIHEDICKNITLQCTRVRKCLRCPSKWVQRSG